MMASLLRVSNLVTGYAGPAVLKGISFEVGAGEAVAVLGANGAGKTTLMRCIAGLARPWEGAIVFGDEDVTRVRAEDRPALGIVLAPEGRGLFATLSIEENLLVGATALRRRVGAREARAGVAEGLDHAYALFPVLKERRRDLASRLSGGQQQMVAIARALMARPRLLLLDEPCLGLAPKVGNDVYAALRTLRGQGLSLVVVEESTRRALGFVDRACVLKLGQKVLEGQASALTRDEELLQAYFGLTSESTDVTL
jgi:branched-chain amino acid transport system ATP-binding protein